jgi:hypothetical protein
MKAANLIKSRNPHHNRQLSHFPNQHFRCSCIDPSDALKNRKNSIQSSSKICSPSRFTPPAQAIQISRIKKVKRHKLALHHIV